MILRKRTDVFHDAYAVQNAIQAMTSEMSYAECSVLLCVAGKILSGLQKSEDSIEVELTDSEKGALIQLLMNAPLKVFARTANGNYAPPVPGVLYLMITDLAAQLQTEE